MVQERLDSRGDASLVTQCGHRVDSQGAAGGNVAREQGQKCEYQGDHRERGGITGAQRKSQRCQIACGPKAANMPMIRPADAMRVPWRRIILMTSWWLAPVMEKLHGWLEVQFAERKTEPNSGLGKAITYLLRHWKALTTFLREAGTPLDNNLCERALKRAVLHRKNALFYRTLHGAEVGDLFMTLIHTCPLCGANSFDYLTEIQRHVQELAADPAEWMPWNYRQTLARSEVR
jgi:hypothetical protein